MYIVRYYICLPDLFTHFKVAPAPRDIGFNLHAEAREAVIEDK